VPLLYHYAAPNWRRQATSHDRRTLSRIIGKSRARLSNVQKMSRMSGKKQTRSSPYFCCAEAQPDINETDINHFCEATNSHSNTPVNNLHIGVMTVGSLVLTLWSVTYNKEAVG